MKRMRKTLVLMASLALFFMGVSSVRAQTGFTLLHSFAGQPDDGTMPYDSLISDGGTLYGTTLFGGSSNSGTIFSIRTDRSGFTLLHSFAGGNDDGDHPHGSLISDGSNLYGMTYDGGSSDRGTIFSIQTDRSGFTLLHSFNNLSVDNGDRPYGSLIRKESTLYGMTRLGGSTQDGTIFSIRTDHNGFTLLHNFSEQTDNGERPWGSLISDGSTLYGMTYYGGSANKGTIFSIQTDQSGFTFLHSFSSQSDDGRSPYGSMILNGSTLYGMTYYGGHSNRGTIFSIRTDQSGFTLLHSFSDQSDNGSRPRGNLILDGSTLYGMTYNGGFYSIGTIFSIQTDRSGFTLLHSFSGGSSDGSTPRGSLLLNGNTLYGMTYYGGSSNEGTVFSLGLEEPTPTPSGTAGPPPSATPTPSVTPTPIPPSPSPTPTNGGTPTIPPTTVTPSTTPTPTPGAAVPPWIYDYNGDGTSDIAIFRTGSGLWAIRGVTRVYFGGSTDETVPGDYDGNGTTDLSIFRPASGLWAIRGVTRAYFGGGSDLAEPGDYDGDGTADIGIFRGSSGLWAIHGVTRVYFGGSTDEPVPGYYDADGSKDIGVFRGSSGLWAIRGVTRVYFGGSADEVVPGDYDGDGVWDEGIFRPTSGLWAIRGVTRAYFGSFSDTPVPADYVGAGTDSIGIFRPTSGLWAVKGMTRIYFGGSNDLPVTR